MEVNINLIPNYKKEEITQTRRLRAVIEVGVAIFFVAILFFVFMLSLEKTLGLDYDSVSSYWAMGTNKDQYEKIREYEEKFKTINANTQQVIDIKKDQLYWSNMLLALSGDIANEIEISTLTTKNYTVSLAGMAKTRDDLIAFKDRLEKDSCFSSVDLPLSNLVSQQDISFQMDLKIKEECVKKK